MARGIRGVALIVTCRSGEILVLQEFARKPFLGKYPGMYSIPMETRLPHELDPEALQRLLDEELTGLLVEVTPHPVGRYRIAPRVWVSLYLGRTGPPYIPQPESLDVDGPQWLMPAAALDLWLRRGAREMLEDYLANRTNIVRRHCSQPPVREVVRSEG